MSVSIVVDMSLSPEWVSFFQNAGWPAIHWSSVGDIRALDTTIMAWAVAERHVVFTHDLDFGALLARTERDSDSHATRPARAHRNPCCGSCN